MIHKKSREEIKIMRHAGNIVALVHDEMKRVVEPGISTLELDKIAYDIIKKNKAIPTFLGYNGFYIESGWCAYGFCKCNGETAKRQTVSVLTFEINSK